jgi:hypothetical protein
MTVTIHRHRDIFPAMKYLLFFFGFICAVCLDLKAQEPDAREYKLTLDNQKCMAETGVRECWNAIVKIANEQNITVKAAPTPWKSEQREILFYDTADEALRQANFLLRQRTKIKKNGQADDTSDLTLKFRGLNREAALAASVEPCAGEVAKFKFKEEMVLSPEPNPGYHTLYQRAAKIKKDSNADMGRTFGSWAQLFPGLTALALPSNTAMGVVKERRVIEAEQTAGSFALPDGIDAEANFSCWRVNGKLMAVEFSFQIKDTVPADSPSVQTAAKFYAQLVGELGGWLNPAGTKTSEIYAD